MTFPSAWPVLSALIWTPALGAIVTAGNPAPWRRAGAIGFAALTLALGFGIWLGAGPEPGWRELHPWIPALGVSYELALDELGSLLVVSIPLVTLLSLLDERRDASRILVGECALLGLVLSRDVFLFLAFLGAGALALTRLTTRPRATRSVFFFHSTALGLAVFFSLNWYHLAYVQSGFPTAEIARFATLVTYPEYECWTFLVGAAAAALLAPLFPLGSWLAEASDAVSRSGRVLLFGGFSSIAAVLLTRLVLPAVPLGRSECSGLVVVLAALSTLYAGLVPYRGDSRRSFTPLLAGAQGVVVLGLLSDDPTASSAARLAVVGIGLGFGALALLTDGEMSVEAVPSRRTTVLAGLLAALVLWLPASNGAPSLFWILRSYWDFSPVSTVLAGLGTVAMAARLALAVPGLARAGAAQPRLRTVCVLPLLLWWLVAVASQPTPQSSIPAEVLTEVEE